MSVTGLRRKSCRWDSESLLCLQVPPLPRGEGEGIESNLLPGRCRCCESGDEPGTAKQEPGPSALQGASAAKGRSVLGVAIDFHSSTALYGNHALP
jgi:hypothetical protein